MGTAAPVLDKRTSEDIYKQALELARHYCPELTIPEGTHYFDPDDPGLVLLKLFSKQTEYLTNQINKIPDKHRFAFFDFAGIDLLPARPSRLPLTFYPSEGSKSFVFVPSCTRVASTEDSEVVFETLQGLSVIPENLNSVLSLNPWEDKYTDHSTVVSGKDDGFQVFGGDTYEKYMDHVLYFGDDVLLDIRRPPKQLILYLEGTNLSKEYFNQWYDGSGAQIENIEFSDVVFNKDTGSEKLEITIAGENNGSIRKLEPSSISGTESFWLWVRPVEGLIVKGTLLPRISKISADIIVEDVLADIAFVNNIPIDIKKGFFPFGEAPKKGDTLYIASEEAFSKEGAELTFGIQLETPIEKEVQLLWEYWNGSGWEQINVSDNTNAFSKSDQIIMEACPSIVPVEINGQLNRWIRIRVLSEEAYGKVEIPGPEKVGRIGRLVNKIKESSVKAKEWVISKIESGELEQIEGEPEPKKPSYLDRLISGRIRRYTRKTKRKARVKIIPRSLYGPRGLIKRKHFRIFSRLMPNRIRNLKRKIVEFVKRKLFGHEPEPPAFTPPFIQSVNISYSYKDATLGRVKTFNNFQYDDLSLTGPEEPYRISPEGTPVLYLGFKKSVASFPITLFFAVKKALYNEEITTINDPGYHEKFEPDDKATNLTWQYYDGFSWQEFNVEDETDSFRTDGIVSFLVPPDITSTFEFGRELYWIKTRINGGRWISCPRLTGIFPNTVWTLNNVTLRDEILGSGNGETNLTLAFSNKPVLEGQVIEIKEMDIPSKEELHSIESRKSGDAFRVIEEGGEVKEVWVLWNEVKNFALSGSLSRDYVLDREQGTITFGDGIRGMMPPKGTNNIIARYYKSGGGTRGDVAAGTVTSLKKTIPNIDRVVNHVPSSGGMDQENIESAAIRGPHAIKTMDRAVTKEDFEWLAKEASQYVARARCMVKNDQLTMVIVPRYEGDAPLPDTGLIRSVENHLKDRALLTIRDKIEVIGSDYVTINVYVNVKPVSLGESALIVEKIEKRVTTFLHPLTGGMRGEGWDFGQAVVIAQMAAVIEDIEGVDYVKEIVLIKIVSGNEEETATGIEQLFIEPDSLACAGTINVEIAE